MCRIRLELYAQGSTGNLLVPGLLLLLLDIKVVHHRFLRPISGCKLRRKFNNARKILRFFDTHPLQNGVHILQIIRQGKAGIYLIAG